MKCKRRKKCPFYLAFGYCSKVIDGECEIDSSNKEDKMSKVKQKICVYLKDKREISFENPTVSSFTPDGHVMQLGNDDVMYSIPTSNIDYILAERIKEEKNADSK